MRAMCISWSAWKTLVPKTLFSTPLSTAQTARIRRKERFPTVYTLGYCYCYFYTMIKIHALIEKHVDKLHDLLLNNARCVLRYHDAMFLN